MQGGRKMPDTKSKDEMPNGKMEKVQSKKLSSKKGVMPEGNMEGKK